MDYYDGRPTFFRINGNLAPGAVTAQVRDALTTSRALALRGGVTGDDAAEGVLS